MLLQQEPNALSADCDCTYEIKTQEYCDLCIPQSEHYWNQRRLRSAVMRVLEQELIFQLLNNLTDVC